MKCIDDGLIVAVVMVITCEKVRGNLGLSNTLPAPPLWSSGKNVIKIRKISEIYHPFLISRTAFANLCFYLYLIQFYFC